MINNKKIVKTTGGKVNSQVVTVAIDSITGDVYYGLSNPLNNPTHSTNTHFILEELIDSAGTPPIAYNGNGFYNCGEFCAINNALNSNLDINNLYVYSINIKSPDNYLQKWDPCENCQNIYKVFDLIFVDWRGEFNCE